MADSPDTKRHARKGASYFFRRLILSTVGRYLGASAGIMLWQCNDAARNFRVVQCDVSMANLSPGWDGAKVALLTDLHIGRWIKFDLVEKWFAAALAASPDLILLGGDYGRFSNSTGRKFGEMLRQLASAAPTLAIWGNHDYYHRRHIMLEKIFRDAGVRVLVNQATSLRRGGGELIVAGLDDTMQGQPDLTKTLATVGGGSRDNNAPAATILLSHNPDGLQLLPENPSVDLVLCGHTHAGQIRLPIIADRMAPVVSRRYIHGLVRDADLSVYISAGLGVVGLPIRYNCPPELPVLTLKKQNA